MKVFVFAGAAAVAVVAIVALAGFFYGDKKAEAAKPAHYAPSFEGSNAKLQAPQPALSSRAPYKRTAELSLLVTDAAEAYERLEKLIEDTKSELVSLNLSGADQSRSGRMVVEVPQDRFRAFLADARKLGSVKNESITHERMNGLASDQSHREAELAFVTISWFNTPADPDKGVVAGAWSASISHMAKGLAVLIEIFGFLFPFLLAGFLLWGLIAVSMVLVRRLRRERATMDAAG